MEPLKCVYTFNLVVKEISIFSFVECKAHVIELFLDIRHLMLLKNAMKEVRYTQKWKKSRRRKKNEINSDLNFKIVFEKILWNA